MESASRRSSTLHSLLLTPGSIGLIVKRNTDNFKGSGKEPLPLPPIIHKPGSGVATPWDDPVCLLQIKSEVRDTIRVMTGR